MAGDIGQFFGGTKSIQRGVITLGSGVYTATATLSPAVDTTKTRLRFNGWTNDQSTALAGQALPYIVLTNGTTVSASRTSPTGTATVSWEVEESY